MRATDFLVESITFSPAKLEDYKGEKVWSSSAFGAMKSVPCWYCEGTGIEGYYKKDKQKQYYPGNPQEIEQHLINWDKGLKAMIEKEQDLESRYQLLKTTLDGYKESLLYHDQEPQTDLGKKIAQSIARREAGHPADSQGILQRLEAKLADAASMHEALKKKIERRMAQHKKKLSLVKNLDQIPCNRCDGKGKTEEWVSDAPELNVSNANAEEIQKMLGVEPDFAGSIDHKDLPAIMRRLLVLKNKGAEQYTKPSSQSQGKARISKDDEGMARISRGPTMYDFGRSSEQVNRYVDELIKMVQFAQKNGAGISWG